MKKALLLFAAIVVCSFSSIQAAGGAGPCLATLLLDPRLGLYMNEGKSIETNDFIRYLINPLGSYLATKDKGSCCVAVFWGNRAGQEFKTYKLRSKEVLMCIPVVNIYPCIALPLEAYSGKTFADVVKEEGLTR
jgi:hypothetical protein